ncbi:MAG: type II toxin-antitoxin system Phd/YefM family antitoxin [Candidatus Hydrogenedentes bacterium]|nr:type II toxin-antitoxin system Phd/YefM family antitoxin [Candidatus Hydrogenedentota bacterium]MBI3119490.1 type II toxin-antitoxin system Phd/YefM family antitoxin [Candidatus Hydrogenedentota bacterium]
METIAISEFKAKCLAVLERVRTTGQPIEVTKRGVPVAVVQPPRPKKTTAKSSFGCMAGTIHQIGDILEPLPESDWEVLR